MKAQHQVTYRSLCQRVGISYSQVMRWRGRAKAARPLLMAPGPKKTEPLPEAELRQQIHSLKHGGRRSRGTGKLYRQYEKTISRRQLTGMVKEARLEKRRQLQRVEWHGVGTCWAMDATQVRKDQQGGWLWLCVVQDLASRYRFPPMASTACQGKKIARYLEELFLKYGPPLFIKRDNGSPFNNAHVDALLTAHGVISLNSPAHYARYNGAVERSIREEKDGLLPLLPECESWDIPRVESWAGCIAEIDNRHPRRSLHGQSALDVFRAAPARRYSLEERATILRWIKNRFWEMIPSCRIRDRRAAARTWRIATESWLRCQGLISVQQKQPSVTPLIG